MTRSLAALGVLGAATMALAACGGAADSTSSSPPSATQTSVATAPSTAQSAGYSDDCRLAAKDWADQANKAQIGLTMGTSAADLTDSMQELTNQISVSCGKTGPLFTAVAQAQYDIALEDAELQAYGKLKHDKLTEVSNAVKQVDSLVD